MDGHDRVETIVRPAGALQEKDWQELWELNREFFDVERWYAENELFRRQHIAMFRRDGALIGMAAIDIYGATFRGRPIAVILTMNVLLRESWRGQNLIQKLGLRTFLRARLQYPFRPIYWFFDSLGYKGYLLLPRNFVTYWPRREQPTPESAAALLDQLATQIYGPAWQPFARRGRSIGSQTPARHHRAAEPGGTGPPRHPVLRPGQSGTRRGRHAALPVSVEPFELGQPRKKGARTAPPPQNALTAAASRATLSR